MSEERKNRIKTKLTVGKRNHDFNTEMVLTPDLAEKYKDLFEIEFLQGITVKRSDGMVWIRCNLSDEKVKALQKAISSTIFGDPNERMC